MLISVVSTLRWLPALGRVNGPLSSQHTMSWLWTKCNLSVCCHSGRKLGLLPTTGKAKDKFIGIISNEPWVPCATQFEWIWDQASISYSDEFSALADRLVGYRYSFTKSMITAGEPNTSTYSVNFYKNGAALNSNTIVEKLKVSCLYASIYCIVWMDVFAYSAFRLLVRS